MDEFIIIVNKEHRKVSNSCTRSGTKIKLISLVLSAIAQTSRKPRPKLKTNGYLVLLQPTQKKKEVTDLFRC